MRKLILILALALLPLSLRADTPSYERQIADFSADADVSSWSYVLKQGMNGYELPIDFIAGYTNGVAVELDLTGYSIKLAMRKKKGVDAARLTGVNYGTYGVFTCTSNFLSSPVDNWSLILIATSGSTVVNQPSGSITITPSPELDSGDLIMTRSVNISEYTWYGQFNPTNLPLGEIPIVTDGVTTTGDGTTGNPVVAVLGAGDMTKVVYDTDDSGVVDNSEALKGNTNTPLYSFTELDPSNAVHVATTTGAHAATAIGTTGTYVNVQAWFDALGSAAFAVVTDFVAVTGDIMSGKLVIILDSSNDVFWAGTSANETYVSVTGEDGGRVKLQAKTITIGDPEGGGPKFDISEGRFSFWTPSGYVTISNGIVTATSFVGIGSLLTDLDASQLTGTVNTDRLEFHLRQLASTSAHRLWVTDDGGDYVEISVDATDGYVFTANGPDSSPSFQALRGDLPLTNIVISSTAGYIPVADAAGTGLEMAAPADARTALGLVIGTDVLAPDGDGSGLTGAGDMTKVVYDTDDSGVVDNSEALKGNTNTPLYSFTETDPIWGAVSNVVTTGAAKGDTALQAEADTLATVTARGGTTTEQVTIDAANAHANTYGGAKGIGAAIWQDSQGDASGYYSHADSDGDASGYYSHADSLGTASGDYSHADSRGTASGDYSHADSYGDASGNASHADSDGTANGDISHASGFGATAAHDNSWVASDGTATSSTTNKQATFHYENGIRLLGAAGVEVEGPLDMTSDKITNLADGVAATDAATVGQLGTNLPLASVVIDSTPGYVATADATGTGLEMLAAVDTFQGIRQDNGTGTNLVWLPTRYSGKWTTTNSATFAMSTSDYPRSTYSLWQYGTNSITFSDQIEVLNSITPAGTNLWVIGPADTSTNWIAVGRAF